jgi:hypothetical protein
MNLLRFLLPVCVLANVTGVTGQAPKNRAQRLTSAVWRGELIAATAAIPISTGIVAVDGAAKEVIVLGVGEPRTVMVNGEGPQQVVAARQAFGFRGDSLLVAGRDPKRLVVLSGSGMPTRSLNLSHLETSKVWLKALHGADASGRLLYVSPRLAKGTTDSATVLVVNAITETVDTLGALWYPPPVGLRPNEPARDLGPNTERDQVVLLESGLAVVYRASQVRLDVIDLSSKRVIRQVPLPGRARALTKQERATLERGMKAAESKMDSLVRRTDPELRKSLGGSLGAAIRAGVPSMFPAYDKAGLVGVSADVALIVRSASPKEEAMTIDWVNVRTGKVGSFSLPSKYAIVGGSHGSIVLARFTSDDIAQLATVQLRDILQP